LVPLIHLFGQLKSAAIGRLIDQAARLAQAALQLSMTNSNTPFNAAVTSDSPDHRALMAHAHDLDCEH